MTVRGLLSKSLLEGWVADFFSQGFQTHSDIRVLDQDNESTPQSALVVVELSRASTVTYLEPVDDANGRWAATMEARESAIALDAAAILNLGNELTVLSSLCSFLERKSLELLSHTDG